MSDGDFLNASSHIAKMNESKAAELITKVFSGLNYLHSHNLVHGKLNFHSILIHKH